MRRQLLAIYWAMERQLVPGLQYSQHTYEEFLHRWIPSGAAWLDIGCGRGLFPPWRAAGERKLLARARCLVGIDLSLESLRDNTTVAYKAFGPAEALPFRDGCFDAVTANMVVEHLADPAGAFREVYRVLRPGGLFLFHTPNAITYPVVLARAIPDRIKRIAVRLLEGRHGKDVFPTYYRSNSAQAIRVLAAQSGFAVEELFHLSSTAQFSVIPPLALLELLWLRSLRPESRQHLRSNLIVVLRKAGV